MLKNSQRLISRAAFAVASMVLTGGLAMAQAPAPAKAVKPALSVALTTVTAQNAVKVLNANGSIAAWQEASVSAEVGGYRLASVSAQIGDSVKKGQVLATFATDSVRIDIDSAKAQVSEAEALAADATANASRARSIEREGFYSAAQLGQIFANEKAAQARVQAAKARLQATERGLKETNVHAPDDGVISARNATLGAVVRLGAELFRLIRQNRIEWRADVPANDVGQITKGMKVKVTGANGYVTEGMVRQNAPSADVQTRNVTVFVDLSLKANGSAGVRAGQFAKGEFTLSAGGQVMTLPLSAVVLRDGFAFVFVLGANNKVVQTKVQTGQRSADVNTTAQGSASPAWIEVLSGLKPGAQVVASGATFLADGDTVRVVKP